MCAQTSSPAIRTQADGYPGIPIIGRQELNEYRKKNILLRGDNLPLDKIRKLKGVISLEEYRGEYLVKIESLDIADSIFKIVKDYNITKYDVTEPTLNEIFIEKVGANND